MAALRANARTKLHVLGPILGRRDDARYNSPSREAAPFHDVEWDNCLHHDPRGQADYQHGYSNSSTATECGDASQSESTQQKDRGYSTGVIRFHSYWTSRVLLGTPIPHGLALIALLDGLDLDCLTFTSQRGWGFGCRTSRGVSSLALPFVHPYGLSILRARTQ